jgi:hypothetical protein
VALFVFYFSFPLLSYFCDFTFCPSLLQMSQEKQKTNVPQLDLDDSLKKSRPHHKRKANDDEQKQLGATEVNPNKRQKRVSSGFRPGCAIAHPPDAYA